MAWCFTFGTVLWHIKSACQENRSLQKRVKKLKGYSDESQLQLFLQVPSSFMLQNFFPVFSLRVWGLFLLPLLGLLELQLRRHQVIFQLALKGAFRLRKRVFYVPYLPPCLPTVHSWVKLWRNSFYCNFMIRQNNQRRTDSSHYFSC